MIAEETGADTFKIERATPYPADYDACTEEAQQEQRKNARPELKNTLDNLDDYDVVYLGMPVWWGDMPMPVYTFVEGLDWNGKTVYPFTTHAGSRLSSIPRHLGISVMVRQSETDLRLQARMHRMLRIRQKKL